MRITIEIGGMEFSAKWPDDGVKGPQVRTALRNLLITAEFSPSTVDRIICPEKQAEKPANIATAAVIGHPEDIGDSEKKRSRRLESAPSDLAALPSPI